MKTKSGKITNNSKSLKLNYIYNVSYQILTLITPLITTPYLSRVLKVDGIGLYSYTSSIVAYFIMVCRTWYIKLWQPGDFISAE